MEVKRIGTRLSYYDITASKIDIRLDSESLHSAEHAASQRHRFDSFVTSQ